MGNQFRKQNTEAPSVDPSFWQSGIAGYSTGQPTGRPTGSPAGPLMGAGPIIVSGDTGGGPPMVVPKDNTVTILLIVLVVVVVVVGVVVMMMFSREGRGRRGYGPPYYPEPVSISVNPLYGEPTVEAS